VLHFPPGAAILLGGILAPTDPVLATDVQVRHPGDKDQLRFTLTCEAGMNDGSAFPFVLLGLAMLASATRSARMSISCAGCWWTSAGPRPARWQSVCLRAPDWRRLAAAHRRTAPRHHGRLVALGLIAVVYAVASMVKASGYLAVFFAAVALRQTELVLAGAPKTGKA
jgi:NhaP-type Na+/H+ or K+/H+ antiporter